MNQNGAGGKPRKVTRARVREAYGYYVRNLKISRTQRMILREIALSVTVDGSRQMTISHLGEATGFKARTIQYAIRALEQSGVLIIHARANGRGQSVGNIYEFRARPDEVISIRYKTRREGARNAGGRVHEMQGGRVHGDAPHNKDPCSPQNAIGASFIDTHTTNVVEGPWKVRQKDDVAGGRS